MLVTSCSPFAISKTCEPVLRVSRPLQFPAFLLTVIAKTNGYTELQGLLPEPHCDDDGTPSNSGVIGFSEKISAASVQAGSSFRAPNHFKRYLQEAGFEDVTKVRFKIPTSPWPKNRTMKLIGAFEMQNFLQGASAFSLRTFSRAYGWTQEETELFLMKMRTDVRNLKYHTYYEL
jgi:hypothetical protein